MIYQPEIAGQCTKNLEENPKGYRRPTDLNMNYREVKIITKDKVLLYGWLVYQTTAKDAHKFKTIVYFHENAGNIGFRLPLIQAFQQNLQANVLIVGYRGYGPSTGSPSEQGLMIDGKAILDYVFINLKDELNTADIYVFGKSLGGAVAIYTCSEFNFHIKGMILENTFASMSSLVDHIMPHVRVFKKFVLHNYWPSIDRIHKIKTPTMFDELIPREHMEELHNRAKSVFKHKYVVIGGTHNESWAKNPDEYINQLKYFISQC